ncbi:MAG TPA: hypothetical protein VM577_21250 [Anaerovoracaceae bacterium]|nr:hypothetical protein [Anaerovoracaceae bacterium]
MKKTQVDLIKTLAKKEIKVSQSEMSQFVNGVLFTPKANLVLSESDKILTEWEKEGR